MLFLTCSFIAFIEPVFLAFGDTIANNATTATVDFFAGACFALDVLFNFRTGVYFINEARRLSCTRALAHAARHMICGVSDACAAVASR